MTDPDYICGETTEIQDWTQIKVTVKLEELDTAMAVMSVLDNNLMVEDYSDIDLKTCYGDLIDESILNADKTVASVSLFLPADQNYNMAISFIRERLESEGVTPKIEIVGVNVEDWANSWKKYYTTLHIGKRTVIVPMWEEYEAKENEIVVKMDPGMAFGTGSHETTRLVIELLEKYTKRGVRMLDVGCGSGILGMLALKFGAKYSVGTDLDPCAIEATYDNMKVNGIREDQYEVMIGNIIDDKEVQDRVGYEKYDIVVANILADVLVPLTPVILNQLKPGGFYITSGIIDDKEETVVNCIKESGLEILEVKYQGEWVSVTARKN